MSQTTNTGCVAPELRGTCGETIAAGAPIPLCLRHAAEVWQWCKDKIAAQSHREYVAAEERFEANFVNTLNSMTGVHRQMDEVKISRDDEIRQMRADMLAEAVSVAAIAEAGSVVYYIRFGDRIKIGFSTNVTSRLAALPYDEFLAVEPGGRVVEAIRHKQFAEHRMVGEWFVVAPELLAHIATLPVPDVTMRRRQDEQARKISAAANDQLRPLSEQLRSASVPLFVRPSETIRAMTEADILAASVSVDDPANDVSDPYDGPSNSILRIPKYRT